RQVWFPCCTFLAVSGRTSGQTSLLTKVINDPAVEVCWTQRDVRPATSSARLDSEGFRAAEAMVKKVYDTVTLPTMSTGATDMAYLRGKGVQCYGIGPAIDVEDGPKGLAHIAIRNASSRTSY